MLPLDEAEARLKQSAARAGAAQVALGHSREGRPLELVRFGDASHRALWYGGPHANETIGVSTLVELAERLAAQPELLAGELGWDILLCVDPDGHVRNESWFGENVDLEAYYRGFFRPPMSEYPDWDLPVEYRSAAGTLTRPSTLPEAHALRAALELSRPAMLNALHNAELGGIHYFVSSREAAPALSSLPAGHGIPIEDVAPDDPGSLPFAPGVFPLPSFTNAYDELLASGHPDPASLLPFGQMSAHWCSRFGTSSLVAEVPYWSVTGELAMPSCSSESELVLDAAEQLEAESKRLAGVQAEHTGSFPTSDPLARAALDGPQVLRRTAAGLRAWASDARSGRPLTQEALGRDAFLRIGLPQRYLGMTLAALTAHDGPVAAVSCAEEAFADGLSKLLQLPLTAHPLTTLVDAQLSAGVVVIEAALSSE
jgi:hypothetical protein